jgi:alpha-tubulin suppressor-like RCC1 family protein
LGNSTLEASWTPVPVVIDTATPPTQLASITKIAATIDHTCAANSIGDMYCWGSNMYGELGIGDSATFSGIAVKASLVAKVGAVGSFGAGDGFSCALFADELARCWGYGGYGELGTGETVNSLDPVAVSFGTSGTKPLALFVGSSNGCAILPDGSRTLQCWGYNSNGEVGDGTMESPRLAPVDVKTIAGDVATAFTQVQTVSIGWSHSCAIVTGGAVLCWGRNNLGKLGNGSTDDSAYAKLVSGF